MSNRIIGFTNAKGGVGKTTCSVHFAYWLNRKNSVIMVDTDGQQSSVTWLTDLGIPCQACDHPEDLQDLVPDLAEKYDYVVLDGPAGLAAGEVTKAIYSCADLVLIPCKPSGLDTAAVSLVLRQIRQAQRRSRGLPKAALFLNQAVKGTILLKDAKTYLSSLDFKLLKTVIYHRQAIADAPGQGVTVWQTEPKIASEFEALFKEALDLDHE
jgi:chromosome partitioning protein